MPFCVRTQFFERKLQKTGDFLISVKNSHDNWSKMAGFPFRSPTFNCCFNENDTSTLKLSPFLLLISDELVIFALDKVFIIEGNTSVRLRRCGLKGIALVSIGSSIPSRHCYDECNFNILYHSCGSTIVR